MTSSSWFVRYRQSLSARRNARCESSKRSDEICLYWLSLAVASPYRAGSRASTLTAGALHCCTQCSPNAVIPAGPASFVGQQGSKPIARCTQEYMRTHRQTRPFRQTSVQPQSESPNSFAKQAPARQGVKCNICQEAGAGGEMQVFEHQLDGSLGYRIDSYGFAQFARLKMQRQCGDTRPQK